MDPIDLAHWHKKDVTLDWRGTQLTFAVSQSLFSSHAVDAGSRLLLRSLNLDALPERGTGLDFGCGYGVLGLALKALRPEWRVELIDRDVLAVAFSGLNARRQGWDEAAGLVCWTGIGVEPVAGTGVDLLLWNIPGKAGRPVIEGLTRDAIAALAPDGVLALVVVNPLIDVVRGVVDADADVALEVDAPGSAHTVLHVRRNGGRPAPASQSAFRRGRFDRPGATFAWRDVAYRLTPVYGLPEYDSRGHATDCMVDALAEIGRPLERLVVQGVGQGHVPLIGRLAFGAAAVHLIDRDALALKASRRALVDSGMPSGCVVTDARADLGPLADLQEGTVIAIALPDQQERAVTLRQIRDLAASMAQPVELVVGGSSTGVRRFVAAARAEAGWRALTRRKRRGASAVRIAVRPR